jgi:hypothetical protein
MKKIQINFSKQTIKKQVNRARSEAHTHWREMVEAEAPAGALAAAFAIGTLISTIPVPLVDMALAGYVLRRYAHLPRAPFFVAMAMTNNIVMAPLYASTPKVGGLALGWMADHTAVALPQALLVRVLVGWLLIALGLALASFVLANTGFRGYKATRRSRVHAPDVTLTDRPTPSSIFMSNRWTRMPGSPL